MNFFFSPNPALVWSVKIKQKGLAGIYSGLQLVAYSYVNSSLGELNDQLTASNLTLPFSPWQSFVLKRKKQTSCRDFRFFIAGQVCMKQWWFLDGAIAMASKNEEKVYAANATLLTP